MAPQCLRKNIPTLQSSVQGPPPGPSQLFQTCHPLPLICTDAAPHWAPQCPFLFAFYWLSDFSDIPVECPSFTSLCVRILPFPQGPTQMPHLLGRKRGTPQFSPPAPWTRTCLVLESQGTGLSVLQDRGSLESRSCI